MKMSLQNFSVLVLNKNRDLLAEAGVWAGRTLQAVRTQFLLCFCENLTVQVTHLSGLYSFFPVLARLFLLL